MSSSLELSEKIEPPPVADGYALSLAFLCLLDVVYCVNALNEGQDSSGRGIAKETKTASSVTPVKEAAQETTSEGDVSSVSLLLGLLYCSSSSVL